MKVLPNIISTFRICLVPVFIVMYFTDQRDVKVYAAIIYAVATASDFLDGYLARKLDAASKLGMVLDPLGDKLMILAVMICITIDRIIPLWAVIIVGVKELLMAIGGLVMHKSVDADILPSNLIGKTATVVFFFICAALMLFRNIPGSAAIVSISVAIALTLAALVSYFMTYLDVRKIKAPE